jgi:hypothetical protein
MHHLRQRVEAALAKAAQLIDDWKDATPMASRLLTEVSRNTKSSKANCVLVMPSSKYVELAQRYLVGAQAELAAIGAHLENMESLASRQQQLGSEEMLAMRNLGSFTEHLGNLTASLDSRSLIGNRQADALGSRAAELQNRPADLQSRFANTE